MIDITISYYTFTQCNNGLLQDFIDKFKPRTIISSISKYQNKDITRQTSPKRSYQTTKNLHKKPSNTAAFLYKRTSFLFVMQPPLYIYIIHYTLLYILFYSLHNKTIFHGKAHPKNTVHQQRSIRHETPLI